MIRKRVISKPSDSNCYCSECDHLSIKVEKGFGRAIIRRVRPFQPLEGNDEQLVESKAQEK